MSRKDAGGPDGRKGRRVAPQLLRDMRVVYHTGGKGRAGDDAQPPVGLTDPQVSLWRLLRSDPNQFYAKYQAAEDKFAAAAEKARTADRGKDAQPGTPAERDEGTARAEAVLREQLAKYTVRPGCECPFCGQTTKAVG